MNVARLLLLCSLACCGDDDVAPPMPDAGECAFDLTPDHRDECHAINPAAAALTCTPQGLTCTVFEGPWYCCVWVGP